LPNRANDAGTSASNDFLLHPASTFNRVVAGTGNNPDLSFTANAVSIVTDIEGGTGAGSNTKIFRIALK